MCIGAGMEYVNILPFLPLLYLLAQFEWVESDGTQGKLSVRASLSSVPVAANTKRESKALNFEFKLCEYEGINENT